MAYLGHVIPATGVEMDKQRVAAGMAGDAIHTGGEDFLRPRRLLLVLHQGLWGITTPHEPPQEGMFLLDR